MLYGPMTVLLVSKMKNLITWNSILPCFAGPQPIAEGSLHATEHTDFSLHISVDIPTLYIKGINKLSETTIKFDRLHPAH